MMVQCCEFLVLISSSSSSSFYSLRRYGGTIQGGLARQANQGANRVDAGNRRLANIQGDAPGSATLSPHPRTLLELWEEWMHGIGGRKPAREFTSAERNNTQGNIKQKYYRRNILWRLMAGMIRAGDTPQAASHKIRQAYGFRDSITQITNKYNYDKRHNRVPDGLDY